MSSSRRNRLLILTVIAVALIAVGWVATPLAAPVRAGQPPPNLLVTLTPFILIFVGIILALITFIVLCSTVLNGNIDAVLYSRVEIGLIAGIILGVVGMIQPLAVDLFRYGFLLLLVCTFGFIVWSHLVPRHAAQRDELITTISATELEQREATASKASN